MLLIKLRAGNPYVDEGCIIKSNLSTSEIDAAYSKGQALIGVDLRSHFEKTNILTDEIYEALFDHIDVEEFSDLIHLGEYDWVNLYLKLAKLGNPEFDYSWVEDPIDHHIGGEGIAY